MKINYIHIDDSLVVPVMNKAIFNNCKLANYKGDDTEFSLAVKKIADRSANTVTIYCNLKNEPLFASDLCYNPYNIKVTAAGVRDLTHLHPDSVLPDNELAKCSFDDFVQHETGKQISDLSNEKVSELKDEHQSLIDTYVEIGQKVEASVDDVSTLSEKVVSLLSEIKPLSGSESSDVIKLNNQFKDLFDLIGFDGGFMVYSMPTSYKGKTHLALVLADKNTVDKNYSRWSDAFNKGKASKLGWWGPSVNSIKPSTVMFAAFEIGTKLNKQESEYIADKIIHKSEAATNSKFLIKESPADEGGLYIKDTDDVFEWVEIENNPTEFETKEKAEEFIATNMKFFAGNAYVVEANCESEASVEITSEWQPVIDLIKCGMGVMEAIEAEFGCDKELCDQLFSDFTEAYPEYLEQTSASVETTIKDILSRDNTFKYQLLSRMQMDCEYYINGNRASKHLWAGTPEKQIETMKAIWNDLNEKPEWLTMEQIEEYDKDMSNVAQSSLEKWDWSVQWDDGEDSEGDFDGSAPTLEIALDQISEKINKKVTKDLLKDIGKELVYDYMTSSKNYCVMILKPENKKPTTKAENFEAPIVHTEILLKGKEPSVLIGKDWRAHTYTLEVRQYGQVRHHKEEEYYYVPYIMKDPGYPDHSGIKDILNKNRKYIETKTKEEAIKLAKEAFKKMNITLASSNIIYNIDCSEVEKIKAILDNSCIYGYSIDENKCTLTVPEKYSFIVKKKLSKYIKDTTTAAISPEDKEKITEDFKNWSGGFTPDECSDDEIETYINYALSIEYKDSEADIKKWLLDLNSNTSTAVHPSERGSQEIKLRKVNIQHLDKLSEYSNTGILKHALLAQDSDLSKAQVEAVKKAIIAVGNRNLGNDRIRDEGIEGVIAGTNIPEFAVWVSSDCMGDTADYLNDNIGDRNEKETYLFAYEKLEQCLITFYKTEMSKSNYEDKLSFWENLIYNKRALGAAKRLNVKPKTKNGKEEFSVLVSIDTEEYEGLEEYEATDSVKKAIKEISSRNRNKYVAKDIVILDSYCDYEEDGNTFVKVTLSVPKTILKEFEYELKRLVDCETEASVATAFNLNEAEKIMKEYEDAFNDFDGLTESEIIYDIMSSIGKLDKKVREEMVSSNLDDESDEDFLIWVKSEPFTEAKNAVLEEFKKWTESMLNEDEDEDETEANVATGLYKIKDLDTDTILDGDFDTYKAATDGIHDLVISKNSELLNDTDEYDNEVGRYGVVYEPTTTAVHPSEKGHQEIKLRKVTVQHLDKLSEYSNTGILKHVILSSESDLSKAQIDSVKKALVAVGNRNLGNDRMRDEGVEGVIAGTDIPEFAVWVSSDCMGETADYLNDNIGDRNAKDTYSFAMEKFEQCLIDFYKKELNKSNFEDKLAFWKKIIYDQRAIGSQEFVDIYEEIIGKSNAPEGFKDFVNFNAQVLNGGFSQYVSNKHVVNIEKVKKFLENVNSDTCLEVAKRLDKISTSDIYSVRERENKVEEYNIEEVENEWEEFDNFYYSVSELLNNEVISFFKQSTSAKKTKAKEILEFLEKNNLPAKRRFSENDADTQYINNTLFIMYVNEKFILAYFDVNGDQHESTDIKSSKTLEGLLPSIKKELNESRACFIGDYNCKAIHDIDKCDIKVNAGDNGRYSFEGKISVIVNNKTIIYDTKEEFFNDWKIVINIDHCNVNEVVETIGDQMPSSLNQTPDKTVASSDKWLWTVNYDNAEKEDSDSFEKDKKSGEADTLSEAINQINNSFEYLKIDNEECLYTPSKGIYKYDKHTFANNYHVIITSPKKDSTKDNESVAGHGAGVNIEISNFHANVDVKSKGDKYEIKLKPTKVDVLFKSAEDSKSAKEGLELKFEKLVLSKEDFDYLSFNNDGSLHVRVSDILSTDKKGKLVLSFGWVRKNYNVGDKFDFIITTEEWIDIKCSATFTDSGFVAWSNLDTLFDDDTEASTQASPISYERAQEIHDNVMEDDTNIVNKDANAYTIYLKSNILDDITLEIKEKFNVEASEVGKKSINVYTNNKDTLSKIIDFIGNSEIVKVSQV